MKKTVLAVLIAVGLSGAASGAGYDALNAGIEYSNNEAWENAVVWLGKAIDAGDLLPDQLRVAHYDRARAYMKIGKPGESLADYTAALATTPDDLPLLRERALAYVAVGKGEQAIADLKKAHERKPKNITINFDIGLVNWALDRPADASAAFASSLADSKSHYAWLWLKLSDLKQKKETGLYRSPYFALSRGYALWPQSLVEFYSGDKEEAFVFENAQEYGDSESCDANFFVAEWRLAHNDASGAKPLFQKVIAECPKGDIESQMARVELGKLS